MIDTAIFKLLAALATFILTITAGLYPFRKKASQLKGFDFPQGESLACGVFLGAALLHMLHEAAGDFQARNIHYPLAYLLSGALFLAFLWLEHFGRELYAHRKQKPQHLVWLWMLMLSMHSFLSGTALGLSGNYSLSLVLFVAIIAHKWAEAFAFSIIINKEDIVASRAKLIFFIFALMTPLGILVGGSLTTIMSSQSLLLPIFSSLAAGTFLYLGTLHGLDKGVLVKQCCNLRNFTYVILGFLIMAVVALYT